MRVCFRLNLQTLKLKVFLIIKGFEMIRHRNSRFYEDFVDEYIASKNKTKKQSENIEEMLNNYIKEFEKGIELKNGSVGFKLQDSGVKYFVFTVNFKGKEFYNNGYGDSEDLEYYINGEHTGTKLSFESGKLLFKKLNNSFIYDNYTDLLDFLTEICEKDKEIKNCFSSYSKYLDYEDKYIRAKNSRSNAERKIYYKAQDEVYSNSADKDIAGASKEFMKRLEDAGISPY